MKYRNEIICAILLLLGIAVYTSSSPSAYIAPSYQEDWSVYPTEEKRNEAASTEQEFIESIVWARNHNVTKLTWTYPYTVDLKTVMPLAINTAKNYRYVYPGYYIVLWGITGGQTSYELYINYYQPNIDDDSAQVIADAKRVLNLLYMTGQLNRKMTELERASKIKDWIVMSCDYQTAERNSPSKQFAPFGTAGAVLLRRLANCSGFSSAYALLLNLDGITCRCEDSETHAWNIATLDGETYYIDTTFLLSEPWDMQNNFTTDEAAFRAYENRYIEDSGWKLTNEMYGPFLQVKAALGY